MNKFQFLLLILVAVAVPLVAFYFQFRNTPASQWAVRVRQRLGEIARRKRDLAAEAGAVQARLQRISDDLFAAYKKTVPVDGVAAFDGIGPATVETLKSERFASLADLIGYDFTRIKGFGDVRNRDLRNAVAGLEKQAKATFDAGRCPEGAENRRQAAAIEAAEREATAARARELDAIAATERELTPVVELERQVTFLGFLTRRPVGGLTPDLMSRPLPSVTVGGAPVSPATVPPPAVEAPRASVPPPPPAIENPQLAKLRTYCQFAFVAAKADGRVAQSEKKAIRELLVSSFGADLLRFIDPTMEATEKAIPEETATITAARLATTPDERRQLYAFAEMVADAAGERNQREADFLARLANAFDLSVHVPPPPPTAVPLPPPPAPEPAAADPRALLNIEPGVTLSPELIRRRFTLLSEKLDPSKAAALGAEFAAMAAAKRTALRQAAETLIAPFHVPLDLPAAPPPSTDIRHNPALDDLFS